jgi:hypothetical protein
VHCRPCDRVLYPSVVHACAARAGVAVRLADQGPARIVENRPTRRLPIADGSIRLDRSIADRRSPIAIRRSPIADSIADHRSPIAD